MSLEAARYELPLARPLQLGFQQITTRCGRLVRRGGVVGDACPLPAFSPDDLRGVDAALEGGAMTESLEWALHSLGTVGPASVRTAGLATSAGDVLAPGHACVKLKVGRQALAEELAAVHRLREQGVQLRLDGNRSLSLEDAARLADAAGPSLEFLEEPVAAEDLAQALERMPVALDETLLEGPSIPEGAVAFVVKPTVLGARRTLALVDRAARDDIPVVVSSSYESAVGRAALIRFAAAVAPGTAHGLGTGPAFARDFMGWVREDGDRLSAADGELPAEWVWAAC